VVPCRLWGITLGELYPLMRMYPIIGRMAAEYVQLKTMNDFAHTAGGARVRQSGVGANIL
jgi:hypothetical protein